MNKYDQFAAQLSDGYKLFALALTGMFAQTVAAGVSPHSITRLQSDGLQAVNSFMQMSSESIDHYLITIDDGVVTRSMRDRQSAFLVTLRALTTKNLTNTVLRAKGSTTGFGQMLKETGAGLFEALMKKRMEQPFTARDSAGRNWNAGALVRTQARDLAYQTLIDSQAAKIGTTSDLASVSYSDNMHDFFGLRLSLTGATPGFQTLASVRAKVFHPNANAELVPYV